MDSILLAKLFNPELNFLQKDRCALEYIIVVVETANSPATLQYLAPYTGPPLAKFSTICPLVFEDNMRALRFFFELEGV